MNSPSDILALYELPLNDLLYQAHRTHRRHWDANAIQISSLVSIKTGGCAEDCHYCPQSAHYDTGLEATGMISTQDVVKAAGNAKVGGATRFCMGAAWRQIKDRDLPRILEMIKEVKALGMETCMTLGMLERQQAEALHQAGLDYYNHNVDTSPEFFPSIVTTRNYQDRLETIEYARNAGMKICSGGIIGMGEERADRARMIETLSAMSPPPDSVPINLLLPIKGTPLANAPALDVFELVRTVAVARIAMPNSHVRLSAGRAKLSEEAQALCFFAGANSIFSGEKLLTADNADTDADHRMFAKLGLRAEPG